MANERQAQDQKPGQVPECAAELAEKSQAQDTTDGLKDKKPEDLTPEELRLMADTMPGEGPGD